MKSSYISEQLSSLKAFIIKPVDSQLNLAGSKKFKLLLFLFVIDIVITSFYYIIFDIVSRYVNFNIESNLVEQFVKSAPISVVVILFVILGPIIEEYIFRYFLRFDKAFPLRIIQQKIVKKGASIEEATAEKRAFWDKHFRLIFYSPLLIFAFLHILNYPISLNVVLLLPILVLPQFIGGTLNGYARVRIDMFSAISLHILHNFVFIGIGILELYSIGEYQMHQKGEIYYTNNENYAMKIEEIVGSTSDTSNIELYYQLEKFKAMNVSIEELNQIFTRYISEDKSINSKRTYRLVDDGVFSKFFDKKYNIQYRAKREYSNNIDTIISFINKNIVSSTNKEINYSPQKMNK